MQPVDATPEEVQRMILSENILPPGEHVKVVTIDEVVHEFRVQEVDTGNRVIIGKDQTIPVDEVIGVETSEFSIGKTALLAGGTYGALALILIAIAPALVLSGG